MRGFDPGFRDLPGYILGVTHEIWEERGVAALHRYYAPDVPVRSPASVVVGNRGVLAATLATLAEFPDRLLLGEDVIWSGDEEAGFLSSHRILSTATHSGDGAYGRATGRRLRYRAIADCAAKENVIYDEWLIRDQGAVVRQLGLDPKRYAADRIAAEGGPATCVKPLAPGTDVEARYRGRGNDHPRGAAYADLLSRIMAADLGAIRRHYDRAVQIEMPGGATGHGRDAGRAVLDGAARRLPFRRLHAPPRHRARGPGDAAPRRTALEACGAGTTDSAPSASRPAPKSTCSA